MAEQESTVRISCSQLRLGMKVVELDRPWIESPFTVHGFKITSGEQIRLLQSSCRYVYVAAPRKASGVAIRGKGVKTDYHNTLTLKQALPSAKSTYRQAKSVVNGFFDTLRLGNNFDTAVAKKAVKQCVDSVISNQEAMLWLGLLKNVDEYTARHSLNVGLLSIILGRAEGLTRTELEEVGLCGLLHDMGKSRIPLEILNKEGAFSDEEFAIMKTHTTEGFQLLSDKLDVSAEAANVAHSHHERLNGRGYPQGLAADQISYYTRIVAIADAYDAITSERVYSAAKTALEGLRILVGAKGSHFDPQLVDKFVECIGVFPAGSVAELSTGEVAIVLPTESELKNTPKVLVVRSADKQPCEEYLIDLSEKPRQPGGDAIVIKHLLSDDAFGINLARYHEKATRLVE